MAIHQSVTFFTDGWQRKLRKHYQETLKVIESGWKVEKTPNCHTETNFQYKTDYQQQTLTIFQVNNLQEFFLFYFSFSLHPFNKQSLDKLLEIYFN